MHAHTHGRIITSTTKGSWVGTKPGYHNMGGGVGKPPPKVQRPGPWSPGAPRTATEHANKLPCWLLACLNSAKGWDLAVELRLDCTFAHASWTAPVDCTFVNVTRLLSFFLYADCGQSVLAAQLQSAHRQCTARKKRPIWQSFNRKVLYLP